MAARDHESPERKRTSGPVAKRLRALGVSTLIAVIVASATEHPSPALHGEGLTVAIALLLLVGSALAMLVHPRGENVSIAATVGIIAASSTLVWAQDGGAATAGLFVAVSYAAIRQPVERSVAMFILAAVTLAVAAAHAGRSVGLIFSSELGVVAFFLLASFARRMQEANEQTAALLVELEASRRMGEDAAALRERGRIARDIHDVLAHSLSGLMLQLEGARMLAAQPSSNGRLADALDRAHHLARAGLEEARQAVGALRDDELPGADRLEQLVDDFSRDSQIQASFERGGEQRPLDSQTSLTLYRVAQEALTNVRKHADASRVEVHVTYERGGTRLIVEDHGERVTVTADARPTHGYGLTGMRERAELIGGRLDAGPAGDGYRVELWIPA